MATEKTTPNLYEQNVFKALIDRLSSIPYFAPLFMLLIIILIFAIGSGGTNVSVSNFQNILSLTGVFVIAVQGLTMVLLLGAIDLSSEGVVALAAVMTGIIIQANPDMGLVAFLAALGVGFAAGTASGIIHTKFRMPSFLVTLGMWYVTRGLAVMIIQGQQIALNNQALKSVVDGKIFGYIPIIAVIALGFILFFYILQNNTAFGKRVYAIGGNEVLAVQAGVRVDIIKIIVLGFAGLTYGAVGFFLASRLQIASAQIGIDYLFPVVIASVLGGTALSGGLGGAVNAVIGALAYMFLQNGMILMNINVFTRSAVNGVVLILAVAVSLDRKRMGIIK